MQKNNNEEIWKMRKKYPPLTEEEKRYLARLYKRMMLESELLEEAYPDWTEDQVAEKALEFAKARMDKKYTSEMVFRQQAMHNRQYAARTGDLKKPLTYEEITAWSATRDWEEQQAWEAKTYDPKNDEARRKEMQRLHELDERYWEKRMKIAQEEKNSSSL